MRETRQPHPNSHTFNHITKSVGNYNYGQTTPYFGSILHKRLVPVRRAITALLRILIKLTPNYIVMSNTSIEYRLRRKRTPACNPLVVAYSPEPQRLMRHLDVDNLYCCTRKTAERRGLQIISTVPYHFPLVMPQAQ